MASAFTIADIIKTQWCTPSRVYNSNYKIFEDNMLSKKDLIGLADYIYNDLHRDFLVTYGCIEDIEEVHDEVLAQAKFKILPKFKVASEDVTNYGFLNDLRKYVDTLENWEIILSTGMSTLDEIDYAVKLLKPSNGEKGKLVLMYCISVYPAIASDFDLTWAVELYELFRCPVGFSDHSKTIGPSIMFAGLNAYYIERHVTLGTDNSELDFDSSITWQDFVTMMYAGSDAYKAYQNPRLEITTAEQLFKREEILKTKKWYEK